MNQKPITTMFQGASGRKFLIAIALGLVGAAGGIYFGMNDGTGQSSWNPFERSLSSSPSHTMALEQLQNALEAEVVAREELAARMEELEARVSAPGVGFDERGFASVAEHESPQDDTETDGTDETEEAEALVASAKDSEASQFDDEALLALGVHPRDVERLRDRWVSHELDKDALSNQALREGWFQQPRHRGELIGLELTLRRELQDSDYDEYLYALGKPNRLEAGEVLAGSAASDAGLRRGDVIVRYDDARIFAPGELLMASSSGDSGGSVPLEILRDGRRRTLYVKRGPLGALMEHSRAEPLKD